MEIEEIDKYEELQLWVTSGQNAALSPHLKLYLEQLEVARSLYAKYNSQQAIIKTLMATTPGISRKTAVKIVRDALNYFYADNEVKKDAWRNIYAEKLENAALVAWKDNDMETYRRCIISAAEMRGLNKDDPPKLPEELFDRRPVINVLDSRRVGVKRAPRNEIARMIDEMELTENQKDKLRKDVGIITIDFDEEDAEDQA
jgi:hypothetical protein